VEEDENDDQKAVQNVDQGADEDDGCEAGFGPVKPEGVAEAVQVWKAAPGSCPLP
jgi:hypothetical protein